MKKSLIFKILYLFLVLIVIAGASVFATNTYLSARDVSYGSSNVEEALNGLFTLKGNDENYSTEEKIVGKWIDGKPIYRKVITGLTISTKANNWVSINVGITDMEYPINLTCMRKNINQIYKASRFNIKNTTGDISFIIDDTDTVGGLILEYTKAKN